MKVLSASSRRPWGSLAVLLASVTVATPVVHAGSLSLDLVGSVRYDDNLNRAQRGSERQEDGIFAVDEICRLSGT